MTYSAFIAELDKRGVFRIRPSLGRVRKVLRRLGNPQDAIRTVHIAGTNGKGSVAATLESVFRASGYKTGLYTSPHLIDVRERIQLNGKPISAGFLRAADDVLRTEKHTRLRLTYFELLTAIAFVAFKHARVDIAIIECGLGGKWDATNIIQKPELSILTTIGLDHMEYLGRTEHAIAEQKAGIIKTGRPVVSGVLSPVRSVIRSRARALQCPILEMGPHFSYRKKALRHASALTKLCVNYRKHTYSVTVALPGDFQHHNATLAFAAIMQLREHGWRISSSACEAGFRRVIWPGRFQLLRAHGSAPFLLDGAHNPQAMDALLAALRHSTLHERRKTFLFAAYKDKDITAMGRAIAKVADEVCVWALPGSRGASIDVLRKSLYHTNGPIRSFKLLKDAITAAQRDTPSDGLIVITGSLALVGNALALLNKHAKTGVIHA